MRLTNYTDYSLRVLIYLAIKPKGELGTIKEIAETYGISKNHLMKIIHELGKLEFIETIRGRYGGIRLAKEPKEINIGEVVLKTEEDFHIVECFHNDKNYCVITPSCRLKHVIFEAFQAFIEVLRNYTLEDLIENKSDLYNLLHSGSYKEKSQPDT